MTISAYVYVVVRHRSNPTYSGGWKSVEIGENVKLIKPDKGTRYILEISDFSGIRDGGEYRCRVEVEDYDAVTSEHFQVNSQYLIASYK